MDRPGDRTKARSRALFEQASKVMVGGVSSPVRAFKSVGGTPLFISRGRGAKVWDADGNRYTDYVCSWGALILGHADARVTGPVARAIRAGTSYGAPTELELRLAKEIVSAIGSIEKVRFVNSGTEATMSALRLARASTGRRKLIKFEGCYHGHADPFLSGAGSGMATLDIPVSAGVLESSIEDTITLPYNDEEALEQAFRAQGEGVAAVCVEPVAGNMGVVPAEPSFLSRARKLCTENGSLLIFDEVITGFRVGPGGAQALYRVEPDLTTLGKVIGGGFPVGAYGGSAKVMDLVAPEGPVYQAGTLSGNPVAMAAGLATLKALKGSTYRRLEERSKELQEGFLEGAEKAGQEITVNRVGSMVGLFFGRGGVRNFTDAKRSGVSKYPEFFWEMLERGQYLPPSPFETLFVSAAHLEEDVGLTSSCAAKAFRELGA